MAIRTQRILATLVAGGKGRRPGATQTRPAKLLLEPQRGLAASSKPPVRLFIGTESAQFRAERALIWSIKRVRDPSRSYEIYLMKDLVGFKQRFWLTGFTNYRFAIPDLAHCQGRAIYNDADQIYLEDPAKLFDTEMGAHGVLSINDRDTSVMLIDCARMASIWNMQTAQTTGIRVLEARMRAMPGLWGALDASWNARDTEYISGHSRLLHYTTIHTQPWRPFPHDYVYQPNPAGKMWLALEQEADTHGFQIFDATQPSPDFLALASRPKQGRALPRPWCLAEYRQLAREAQTASLLHWGYDDLLGLRRAGLQEQSNHADEETYDIVAVNGLEQIPSWDVPWLLDRLFTRARRALAITVEFMGATSSRSPPGPFWWYAQLTAASGRYPRVHWRLVIRQHSFLGRRKAWRWCGGATLHSPPRTWVLLYYKTGHRSQALGMAEALGWPYESREITRTLVHYLVSAGCSLFTRSRPSLPGGIRPPWPDIVIGSGWLTALVARWIAHQNHGNTRLIFMGRKGGPVGESQNIALTCRHFRLPPHPQHIETLLPPSKVSPNRLAEAGARWPKLFDSGPHPHVVLLIGGSNDQHRLDPEAALCLVNRVRRRVRESGGSLAVVTSRRTGRAATAALQATAEANDILETWQASRQEDNPYLGYLTSADILVVTGESESMLAEAVATGKPVYIYPLPVRPRTPAQQLADWVYRQALTDRINARGSRRPQEGLQYLCARLLERRLLVPRRNLAVLHQSLVEQGVARMFGGPLSDWHPLPWCEIEQVAERIRTLLGQTGDHEQWPHDEDSHDSHLAHA